MDEKKLAQLIYEQRPEPAQTFDDRITKQVNRLVREEQPMKKKISALAICVIIILSLALCGAVAEMLGLNLFEIFGQKDERLMELAPKAVLNEVSPITVTSPELGTTTAGINSAYYDGQSLLVAYSIANGSYMEEYNPTEEQLAQMEKTENPPIIEINDPKTEVLAVQWNTACQNGTPFGFVEYSITPSDHTITDNGCDLPPYSGPEITGDDGAVYSIREYENPLPEEAQNQECLNIQIRLHQSESYKYFDGQNVYVSFESQEIAPMMATVWRADAQVRHFQSEGSYNGYPVSVVASASAATARVTVTMDGSVFPSLPEDTWYRLYLTDENGNEYRAKEGGIGNVHQMTVSFDGTGKLPERLTLRILGESEGEWDKEVAIVNASSFTLELMQNE